MQHACVGLRAGGNANDLEGNEQAAWRIDPARSSDSGAFGDIAATAGAACMWLGEMIEYWNDRTDRVRRSCQTEVNASMDGWPCICL